MNCSLKLRLRILPLLALALTLGTAHLATAGIVYVSDTDGNVWRYNGVADMIGQDIDTNTGTLVATHAAYATDQDVVADLNPGGLIYRITGDGDIISYLNVAAYLTNSNPLQVGTDNAYAGINGVNGASYDGNTGGFYAVGAGALGSNNRGDIIIYNTLAGFLANAPDSVLVSAYNGNVLNFFDPDTTPGTTVGNTNFPSKSVNAQYYQVPGGGALEGFESIADYDASAVNRVNFTLPDAFGRDGLYQSAAAFAIPIPEPASLLLCLGAACGWMAMRRR